MSRPARRPRIDHWATADRLRSRPGTWVQIGTYRTAYTARAVAYSVGTATRMAMYSPAGAFEARTEPAGDETAVLARYLGGAS